MKTRHSLRFVGSSILAMLFALGISAAAHAHPFHFSFADGTWNEKTQRLEVSLRLEAHDLEDMLRRQTGQAVKLEDEEATKLLEAYVSRSIQFHLIEGQRAELVWVGAEVKVKTVWLYFEVPLPMGVEGVTITNSLLLEQLPDQVNVMALKQGTRAEAFHFSAKQQKLVVKLRENPPRETVDSESP